MAKKPRVLWYDIREICEEHGALIKQHPITRIISLYLPDGRWCWVKNPMTGELITNLSEYTIDEWRGVIRRLLIDLTRE